MPKHSTGHAKSPHRHLPVRPKSGTKHTRDIVFLDGGISEICRLLRELDPQAEVHVLDQHTDGVDQIVTHLAGRKGFQAVHIFALAAME